MAALCTTMPLHAQTPAADSAAQDSTAHAKKKKQPTVLPSISVETHRAPPKTITALPAMRGTMIYAGQKTEVIAMDSVVANTAQDMTRSVLGRVPGLNISETQNSGFPSNGIGFRGLTPVQSVEMNMRQNGVNIVADLYGYPETYYQPPSEAVSRIEVIRGASSLQFGPQFGGVIDYVLRDGTPNTAPSFEFKQTGGSFDLYNSYLSASGGTEKLTYFAYGQYRGQQGWRPNSDLTQFSGAAQVHYQASDRVRFGAEYSMLRNRIHMPGGLDNDEFNANSQQSVRARNWLASPWNIAALTMDVSLSPTTRLSSKLSFMASQRYLVWRNEDGGPSATDDIDPSTNQFVPREVEREHFTNVTSETRLLSTYQLFGRPQTIAVGFRVFGGNLHRQEGGPGSTGSDFDMNLVGGPYETDMKFFNVNVAGFAEQIFRINNRLLIKPGVRVEYLHSTARGYTDTTVPPQARNRSFPLAGIGAEYQTSNSTTLYVNVTQAYRPIEYSYLTPFASLTRIDPHLKDPKGYNADIAWRGSVDDVLDFDAGVFYLAYHDRIGLISGVDSAGSPFTERTNVANSVHKGVESYVNLKPFSLLNISSWGTLGLFDALGYTHARYVSGTYAGKTVEYAPALVNRAGVTYEWSRFFGMAQWSATSKQFGDADNTVSSNDATVGIIPAYQVVDLSAKYRLTGRTSIGVGVNNLANSRYFTFRTTEYPGPGIIPSIGRSAYVTLATGF